MQKVMIFAILLKFHSFGAFIQYFAWVGPTMKLISAIYIPKCNFLCIAKGGTQQKKIISRRWTEDNQEARTGGKHQNFWKKNIYTIIISIKE